MGGNLATAVRALLGRAKDTYRDHPAVAASLGEHLDRLDEPLRLAIAGKVKAGKSTLLNALVGEDLAPTDAGECTRVVTWYVDGHAPAVALHPRDGGSPRGLRIDRGQAGGGLRIDLDGTPSERIERLVVTWPSAGLRSTTLIDTPGIASLSTDASERAHRFLTPQDSPTAADAVLYLLRHLHAADVGFLEAFHDRGVARASPVNTIAVLSRADEVGVGRPDALLSARRIASRYRRDEQLHGLCQDVVAVAGLLAHTARTLRQDEYTALVRLAGLPPGELEGLLRSADRFTTVDAPADPAPEVRGRLFDRFGMFGLRLATTLIRQGVPGSAGLAAELVGRSGLHDLREALATQFTERRDLLKARSALIALDRILRRTPHPGAGHLFDEIERILTGAHQFAELRLISDLRARAVRWPREVAEEAERLVGGGGGDPARRLGLDRTADPGELEAAAHAALGRWRRHAESPLASRTAVDAARVVVRSCEGILVELPR